MELFSEKGYAGTSVRDITTSARCNIAAVNYYFRGKDSLYREVFQQLLDELRELRISRIQELIDRTDEEITLEMVLKTFSFAFLEPLLDESRGRRLMRLFMREVIDPHLPPGMIFTEMIQPVQSTLRRALKKVCPDLDDRAAQLCIISLIGQLLQVLHTRNMFMGSAKRMALFTDLGKVVDHIVQFSVAGIHSYQWRNHHDDA